MGREILLNAFAMNCVGHQSPDLWTHPRDRSIDYNRLDYRVYLAKLLERGKFDALFFADVLGAYDVYGGGPEAALRDAVQVPVDDPALIVPATALVTRHPGFGVTGNLSCEPPYFFARRMTDDAGRTAMDNITRADPGRIWTVRQIAEHVANGGIGPVVIGAPEQVADAFESRIDETGAEGFNLAFALSPESFEDVIDRLLPELRRRRRYKIDYRRGPCAKSCSVRDRASGEAGA